MSNEDNFDKSHIVWLIQNKEVEQALVLLSEHYHVVVPKLKVGLPKGHKRNAYGCYTSKNQTISVLNSDIFSNPFVILHEFYHNLRSKSVDRQHRGTEKNADHFATDFLREYQTDPRNWTS
jgi:Zn-dependent peptidase ImmA (M78 family)